MPEVPSGVRRQSPPDIWTFLAADCAGFTIFFVVFMTERAKQVALFDESSRSLDVRLGFVNTLILVTSGWMVALAMISAERADMRRARRLLMSGAVVGSCFAILKIVEYAHKIALGTTPTTNDFFTFYYILTGIHFLHYLGGLVILAVMIGSLREGHRPVLWLESGALYWHMVDLLWLFLFPMLYLLAGRG